MILELIEVNVVLIKCYCPWGMPPTTVLMLSCSIAEELKVKCSL